MQVHDIIFQNYVKMINCENITSYESTLNQVIDLIELLDKYYGTWTKQINQGVKILNIHQLDLTNSRAILKDFSQYFKSKLDQLDSIAYKENKKWKNTQIIPFRKTELLQFANLHALTNHPYYILSMQILNLVNVTKSLNAAADEVQQRLNVPDLTKSQLHDIDWKLKSHYSLFDGSKYLKDEELPQWAKNNEIINNYNEAVTRTLDLKQLIKVKQEAKTQQIVDWANSIEITPQIRKKYFKNYGYMNGWNEETCENYRKSSALHDIDVKKHPQLHKSETRQPYRCVTQWQCSCGLGYAVDSSD